MELRYNVKGSERKALVTAIAEILRQEAEYQRGFDTYKIGEYVVDKEGTLTGPDDISLKAWIADKGFEADAQQDDPDPATEPVGDAAEMSGEPAEPDRLTISIPAEGFSPEALDNLRKLVDSKAPLIRKALEIDALPIEVTDVEVRFPWFSPELDSKSIIAYSQFVMALCQTAKAKTRVTAQERAFTNEKFSIRVFGIGLGLIGPEYRLIRKLLAKNLSGNSAWSDGIDPRRKPKPEGVAD